MRRYLLGLAVAALVSTTAGTATAQHPVLRNIIRNSGNGVANLIAASNQGNPGFVPGGFAPGGFAPGGYGPVGYAPNGFDPSHFAPADMGGRNVNRIVDSGNGANNTIIAQNRGGGFGGYGGNGFPFGPGGFGVNVNVITNSGNGVGNTVSAGNHSYNRNGVNINVVTNSGNGANNVIRAGNR